MKQKLFYLFVIFSLGIKAQVTVKWVNNFFTGSGVYNGTSIVNDSENHVYSAGDNGNAFIMRFNKNTGARLWYDSLIGTSTTKLKCDANGFLYFIGTFHNATSSTDNSDILIAKFDSLGNKLWQNIYNDSLDFGDYPVDIEFDNSGNVFVVANTENNSNQISFRNNITLFKYSSTGSLIWKRLYGNVSNNSEFAYDFVIDNSGNSYIAGSTTSVSGNPDFLVQKISMNGIPSWSFTLNYNSVTSGSHVDVAHKIVINSLNEIIASGIVADGTTGLTYTAKFNLSGVKLWENKIRMGTCNQVKHLNVDKNNNISLAVNADSVALYGHIICRLNNQGAVKKITASDNLGTSSSFNDYTVLGAFSDKYSNLYVTGYNGQQLQRDCYVIKYDSLGQKKWKYFYSSQASNNMEEGHSICVDSLQDIYVTGYNELSGQSYEKMLNLKLCQIKDYCGLANIVNSPVTFQPKSIASIKFNNDNFYDLVYCDSLNKTLNVYLGGNNNTFNYYGAFSYTWTPADIKNADLNNDGFQDLIIHNSTDDNIAIVLCYGNNSFSTPIFYNSSPNISLVLVSDFNNDSKIDLFTLNTTQNIFSILLNIGSGTFSNTPININHISGNNLIVLGDINNDGFTDVVSCAYSSALYIYKYINTGTVSFNSSFIMSSNFNRTRILLDKFDNDNFIDIAEVVGSGNTKFYKGDGTGNFGNGINPLSMASNISDVVSGDFNNDSWSDLLFSDKNTNTLKMYLSNICNNTMQPYATYTMNMGAGKLTNLNMGSFNSVINTLPTATVSSIWNNNCPINFSSGVVTSVEAMNANQFKNEEYFSVYPNPSSDKITCDFSNNIAKTATLDVINVVGEIVFHTPISTTGHVDIVMKGFTPGIYFVRLNNSKMNKTVKILKMD